MLGLIVIWVVIPMTPLHAWGPKPHWLTGRMEPARDWSMRLVNHRSCHLDLNLNLHLSSWTWSGAGILEYYPSWIWRASLIDGWTVVEEWHEVVNYLIVLWNKVDWVWIEILNLDHATWTSSWEPGILLMNVLLLDWSVIALSCDTWHSLWLVY